MPHRNVQILEREPRLVAFQTDNISTIARTMSDAGFSAAQLAAAIRCTFSVHGGKIHFRWDGTAPTATSGIMLEDVGGAPHAIIAGTENISKLQFIKEQGGPDAVISLVLEQ